MTDLESLRETTMVWQAVISSESGKRCAVVIRGRLVMPAQ